MLHAIIEAVAQPRIEAIERALDTAPGLLDMLPRLMRLAANLAQYSPMPKIAKILIGEGNQFPTLLQEYRSRVIDRLLVALTRLIERARQQGEIVVTDPGLAARLIVAPVVFCVPWQISLGQHPQARMDIPALPELHGQMLNRALSCKEPSQ
ncbi:TetR/AcrR family transcriptional regulator C-terminal domain-containing protein [endosymbiont of unidentified scaly snail isolate Monju]|uniref:TetR/AcrR family transcriptional regulator C-terminal domain-containing protein n=1 Tax=endosymbiont of unidentified scaly snail isolate Monju TaxID=1248727 RepID=UPI00038925D5|nr:TetR/AcrR family transcriptional regulator C-terminal domain-containing protein [endosymbiont of unidentified scaly snail isolate Monju]BAN68987.1 TetR family transcriptional regulator [endosymbiont of unidentified scaly snail isolate Monju]